LVHFLLQKAVGAVKAEDVQNFVPANALLLVETLVLLFRHVLKKRYAPRVQNFRVGVFSLLTKLLADKSHLVEEDKLFFPGGSVFALGVTLDDW